MGPAAALQAKAGVKRGLSSGLIIETSREDVGKQIQIVIDARVDKQGGYAVASPLRTTLALTPYCVGTSIIKSSFGYLSDYALPIDGTITPAEGTFSEYIFENADSFPGPRKCVFILTGATYLQVEKLAGLKCADSKLQRSISGLR